jgi:radical SAM/Cys-rich protein
LSVITTTNREGEDPTVNLPDFTTTVEVDQIKLSPSSSSSKSWRRPDLFGSSLVDQTLEGLETDQDFQSTLEKSRQLGLDGMTKEERTRRRRALNNLGIPPFSQFMSDQMTTTSDPSETTRPKPLYQLNRSTTKILQINIGLYCNQACGHCHVESSPLRKDESMSLATAARCLHILQQSPSITTLDITGGAPELNTHFRYLVAMARALRPELEIIDRCNLTVLQEPGQEDLIDFFKQHNVHIIASLPCYSEDNVDTQRGNGVFERSIAALLALNDAGYGKPDEPNLKLDLVYNPLGAFLPPPQDKLQQQYKIRLEENFGILFHSLFTITNMPIKRFADFLHRRGELQDYMSLLVRNFNKNTVENLMCLDTVSIGWDGQVRTE